MTQRIAPHDFVLLPLIFAMTMVVLVGGAGAFLHFLPAASDVWGPCDVEPGKGYGHKPYCTTRTKVFWEGPWVTQQYNDCGYRTAESCQPREPGELRVAVLGSSVARGSYVDYPQTFAARASAALTRKCGSLVDFQNLAAQASDVDGIDQRMPEVLSLRPTAIVIVSTPYDVMHLKQRSPTKAAPAPFGFSPAAFEKRLSTTRLFQVLQHYLYRDPQTHVQAFLSEGDKAGYVRAPLSAAWRRRVADFADLMRRITDQTAPAHIPVLLFYVPERAHAALAAIGASSPGIDPFILGNAIRQSAAPYGVKVFDTTGAFASADDFQSLYYTVDGHPTAGGHAILADVVAKALLAENGFQRCSQEASSR